MSTPPHPPPASTPATAPLPRPRSTKPPSSSPSRRSGLGAPGESPGARPLHEFPPPEDATLHVNATREQLLLSPSPRPAASVLAA
eukprot:scaffold241023_cov19-Tisochrysis_lutea.AAC.1